MRTIRVLCFAGSALLFALALFILIAEAKCEPGTCGHGTLTAREVGLAVGGTVVGIGRLVD
jgi:hypothetical protein